MLAALLQFLRDNETTISALAGLITLVAAIWGALRLAPALRRLRSESAAAEPSGTAREAAAPRQSVWRGLLNLGLSEHSRLEELVSIRTVNIAFFCLGGISLPWLVYSLGSTETVPLAVINLFVFAAALVGFALQWAGSTTASRWLLVTAGLGYWLGALLAAGPMAGMEYFLVALAAVPVLIFSRAERGQLMLALLLVVVCFVIGVALSRSMPPLFALDTATLLVGYQVNALFLALLVFACVRYYLSFASSSYLLLESKRQHNDALVSSFLPARIAERVRAEDGGPISDWHPEATVLFVSIDGFDELYKRMSAIDLVALLASLFGEFDRILERNGLDKVKTLGTKYVAARGIEGEGGDHLSAVRCAQQMREATAAFSSKNALELTFRGGIATGLAVSGVIAGPRPGFDIWGEALEAAISRCEAAELGQVLVNETAFWRLQNAVALRPVDSPPGTYAMEAG